MKFILTANNGNKRIAFFNPWEVTLFSAIILILFWVLLPKQLLEKALMTPPPSAIALSYLKAYQKIYPNNQQIQFAILEQEISLGEFVKAQADMDLLKKTYLNPSPNISNQIRWLDYLILYYETYQRTKSNTKKRINQLQKLRALNKSLANAPLKTIQFQRLATDSLVLGEASIALEIYDHLLDKNALNTPEELAVGGNIAMQNNKHKESSRFYWAAYKKASTLAEKKDYALKAIQVLWAGNLVSEALGLANQLPEQIINDHATLIYLSRLALAASRPDIAQKYIIKALLTQPDKNE